MMDGIIAKYSIYISLALIGVALALATARADVIPPI